MTPISEILVPTDFSACSAAALEFAKRLAVPCNARLHLLAVDDDPMLIHSETSQSFRDQHESKMAMQLAELMSPEDQQRFRLVREVQCGSAANEIEQYAKTHHIDLIVLGTAGRSEIADVVLGSVAQHVVRHAPCPVVAVRREKTAIS